MKQKILKIKLGAKVSDAKNISLIKANKLNSDTNGAVKTKADQAIKVHSKNHDIRQRFKPKSKTDCKLAGRWSDVLRKDIRNKNYAFCVKTLTAMAKCGLDDKPSSILKKEQRFNYIFKCNNNVNLTDD